MYKIIFSSCFIFFVMFIGEFNVHKIISNPFYEKIILLEIFDINIIIPAFFFFWGSFFTYFFIIKIRLKKINAAEKKREHENTLNEVISGIADGIRNPLVSIKGFIQLEQIKSKSTLKDNIELLLVEIKQIENLISNFLKLSNTVAFNFVVFDIGSQLKQVENLFAAEIDLPNVKLIFNIPLNPTLIKGDPELIKEVVMMLVSNSLEAIQVQKDGIINVELSSKKTFIKITVSDNGPGISPNILPRIGRPFNTTKGTTRQGLGLAICRKIVDIHQGSWEIKTGEKIGTSIKIILPKE
ncbi:MAG: hypothetical protein VR72_00745 [Clostridiaceae bacterium BRH_c20a]|nr:MAG: hypothetical protein VR72_00745 [Clostridiaceae bacterium BRH_c20a]